MSTQGLGIQQPHIYHYHFSTLSTINFSVLDLRKEMQPLIGFFVQLVIMIVRIQNGVFQCRVNGHIYVLAVNATMPNGVN